MQLVRVSKSARRSEGRFENSEAFEIQIGDGVGVVGMTEKTRILKELLWS